MTLQEKLNQLDANLRCAEGALQLQERDIKVALQQLAIARETVTKLKTEASFEKPHGKWGWRRGDWD